MVIRDFREEEKRKMPLGKPGRQFMVFWGFFCNFVGWCRIWNIFCYFRFSVVYLPSLCRELAVHNIILTDTN